MSDEKYTQKREDERTEIILQCIDRAGWLLAAQRGRQCFAVLMYIHMHRLAAAATTTVHTFGRACSDVAARR